MFQEVLEMEPDIDEMKLEEYEWYERKTTLLPVSRLSQRNDNGEAQKTELTR